MSDSCDARLDLYLCDLASNEGMPEQITHGSEREPVHDDAG